MKYETYCPLFPGFYNTVFQYDNEEMDIESYNQENNTDLNYDDFEWNYREYEERICKAFANRLESELKDYLPIKIRMQTIFSPKEYNFSNDSINVEISLDLNRLIRLIKDRKEDAAKFFKDKYTSRSGFISFHSPYFSDWLNKEYLLEKPSHRIGGLLDCLCSIEISQDDITDWIDGESYIDFSPIETVTA